jgi:hypothetical protein
VRETGDDKAYDQAHHGRPPGIRAGISLKGAACNRDKLRFFRRSGNRR